MIISRRKFLIGLGFSILSKSVAQEILSGNKENIELFPQGVASGDPSSTGIVLWTRVNPDIHRKLYKDLKFFVSLDPYFKNIVIEGKIDRNQINEENDFTVKIVIENQLKPYQSYYYSFWYAGISSLPGKFFTLPDKNQDISRVKIAVVNCNDYQNGYFSGFSHISDEDVLFVLHLGDQIYERTKHKRFKDRIINLPSGNDIAITLEDYRNLYRTYLSDFDYQLARMKHSFIYIWSDHEYANDYSFDYEKGYWLIPSHPFNNDREKTLELRKNAIRAWLEYTPTKVKTNFDKKDPLNWIKIYRDFYVGNLLHLICTDTRSYRTPQPCEKRYQHRGCINQFHTDMLGEKQEEWFLEKLKQKEKRWKVWANEVVFSQLKIKDLFWRLDAWDGYKSQQLKIIKVLEKEKLFKTVILSGDAHMYMVSSIENFMKKNAKTVGIEILTSALTSKNLSEKNWWKRSYPELNHPIKVEAATHIYNPWVKFIDTRKWGYSVIEFTGKKCTATFYAVDKNRPVSLKQKLAQFEYIPDSRQIIRKF